MADELEEEDVSEELESKLATEPVDPRLDLQQLRALKAELRNLVPGIHEVLPISSYPPLTSVICCPA